MTQSSRRYPRWGAACHTGNPTCFFNEIVKKEYVEKNPLKVLEDVYEIILDRKAPKEGSTRITCLTRESIRS